MTLTILLIDDSPVDRSIYQRLLSQDQRQSYQFIECESGEAALEWCQHNQADVILLDYRLPQMDGVEFLQKLQQQFPNEIPPIIFLTGVENLAIAVEVIKLGAQDYLSKDHLTEECLPRLVHNVLQQSQLKRKLSRQQVQQQAVSKIALQMRQCLEPQPLLDEATQEIRQFLQADRVLVYQFAPDWSGSIVSESVAPGWPIALGQQIKDTCFQKGGCCTRFQDYSCAATGTEHCFQKGASCSYLQGHTWAMADIEQANLADCHRALLQQFAVKANLVVPILEYVREQSDSKFSPSLWGLLIAHHCAEPHAWQEEEITFLQEVGVHLSGAMQQVNLYQQAQRELQYRRQAESRFQQLVEQCPFAITICQTNGDHTYANSAWETLWQTSRDQVLGFNPFHHPYIQSLGVHTAFEQVLTGAVAELPPVYSDPASLGKPGRARWMQLTLYPITNQQGEVQEVVVVDQDWTERKQAELALQESEEKLRLLIKHSPVSLAMFDREMRYIMASQRWVDDQDREGRSIEDYLGRSHYEIFPDIPERWRQVHQRSLAGAVEKCDEDLFIRSTGQPQWQRWETRPWYTANAEIGGIVIFVEEMTARKQAETGLAKSESRLRLAQAASKSGVWDWDLKTNEVVWTPECYQLYQLDSNIKPNYKTWLNCIHPDDREQATEKTLQAIADPNCELRAEFRVISSEPIRWFAEVGQVLRNEAGEPIRVIGIAIDITEQKQAEQALKASEAQFHQAILKSPFPIKLHAEDGEMLLINQAWTDVTGYTHAEIPTIAVWAEKAYGKHQERVQALIHSRFSLKERTYVGEFSPTTKSGETRIWDLYAAPLGRLPDGRRFMISTAVDCTEQRLAQNQLQAINQDLERANSAKEAFLRMMNHELRTPLTPILCMAEALQDKGLGPLTPKQDRAVSRIMKSGERLLRLVTNMLDLVNLESGKISLDRHAVLVKQLCQVSMAMIASQAEAKSIQLHTRIASGLSLIEVDPQRMQQVLTQLLENAVKFTDEGGTVILEVQPHLQDLSTPESSPASIDFSVKDTGIGIAAENLQNLFQFLTQIDDRVNRNYEGIGIGLALVQRLAGLHGGHVAVESQLGQGSCFTVSIPA